MRTSSCIVSMTQRSRELGRVTSRPPRNYCCMQCDHNGRWAHKCDSKQLRSAICQRCRGDHFIDVCPYRPDVAPSYECKL